MNACQPGVEFAIADGLTNAGDAIVALRNPEWVGWMIEQVDKPRLEAWHRNVRQRILDRLPANLPERPLLVAYIADPTSEKKDVILKAFHARIGSDFQTNARWPMIDAIFTIYNANKFDGDYAVLTDTKTIMSPSNFRTAWESRFGT
jgi:hypothetical protein